jgi:hypothetical protein
LLLVLTLLDTVLLGTLVVLILFLAGDAFNALVEVVLVGSALGGVGALCRKESVTDLRSK